MRLSRPARSAFTLIEMLVVIGVLLVLIAILVPAVQQIRESARRTSCSNNVRQLLLATLNYESARQHLPQGVTLPKSVDATTSQELYGWFLAISSYLEAGGEENLQSGDLTIVQAIAAPEGDLVKQILQGTVAWRCPSDSAAPGLNLERPCSPTVEYLATSSYVAANNVGYCQGLRNPLNRQAPLGAFDAIEPETLAAFEDGTSHTVLFSERIYGSIGIGEDAAAAALIYGCRGIGNAVDYTIPGIQDITFASAGRINFFDSQPFPGISRHGVSSGHLGVVAIGTADGSTHFISDDVESYYRNHETIERPPSTAEFGVWERLIALADGQVVAIPK